MVFLVEITVMNKTQISGHYILVRAANEDTACTLAQELYEKKQTNVGDVITSTWAEPFEEDDDYLIVC